MTLKVGRLMLFINFAKPSTHASTTLRVGLPSG